jgi:hypothetical protein
LRRNTLQYNHLSITSSIIPSTKMFFTQSFLTALAATTAFASPMEKRAVTASQMVANIDQLTKMSQDLTLVANNIDSGNTAISKRQSNPFQVQFSVKKWYNIADPPTASHHRLPGYHPTSKQGL